MSDDVSDLFRQVAANMTAVVDGGYPQAVSKAVDLIYETFSSGQKLLVFGNGGSSAVPSTSPLNSSGGLLPSAAPFPPW